MSSTPSPKSQKMTEGNITKLLITFALPLFVGNLFQQFYNTVDSIVVGNFVSKTALAAVGSTDCIINTIIGFFTGLSTSAGVVIAHSFGSGNDKGSSSRCTYYHCTDLCVVCYLYHCRPGLIPCISPVNGYTGRCSSGGIPVSAHLFCRCFRPDALQYGFRYPEGCG